MAARRLLDKILSRATPPTDHHSPPCRSTGRCVGVHPNATLPNLGCCAKSIPRLLQRQCGVLNAARPGWVAAQAKPLLLDRPRRWHGRRRPAMDADLLYDLNAQSTCTRQLRTWVRCSSLARSACWTLRTRHRYSSADNPGGFGNPDRPDERGGAGRCGDHHPAVVRCPQRPGRSRWGRSEASEAATITTASSDHAGEA